jgi:flagellar motor switch protein FliN/FliY
MTESASDIVRGLAGRWADLLTQILQSMTDQKPQVNWSETSAPEAGGMFWWEQHLSLDESALVWVGAPAPAWNELGGRTLRSAGIDTVEEADARNTYLEILSQSLSGLAQAIGSKLGAEVTCGEGTGSETAPAQGHWVSVEVVYEDLTLPGIMLGFSLSLMDRLQHAEEAAPQDEEPAEQALERREPAPAAPATLLPQSSKTLDLLLDVELPVSVSFGRAELMLKDVLKLTTGSIVELNRGVSEPVEVIVNNCVVARGEVVVMDGNYGVRIHHIISPQERLRTLK